MPTFALVGASDFAAGDFLDRLERGEIDTVVAVDSGFASLGKIEVVPDVTLGDFDSLGFIPECALVHPAIKDKSDLELAFDYALGQGATDIVVYGCLGGRLDHTLAALQNLATVAEQGVRVRAIGASIGDANHANSRSNCSEVVEVLAGPGELVLSAAADAEPENVPALGAPTYGTVSIFAAGDQAEGIEETGMYYSLDNATLTNRTSRGLSNELIEREGTIKLKKGTLYIIYSALLVGDSGVLETFV